MSQNFGRAEKMRRWALDVLNLCENRHPVDVAWWPYLQASFIAVIAMT